MAQDCRVCLCILMAGLLLIAGCSSFSGSKGEDEESAKEKNRKPVAMELEITASDFINPDDSGLSNPVVLRIYQLKVARSFEQASFLDLYQAPEAQLQGTLLEQEFLPVIMPGQRYLVTIKLEPEARFIAAVAGFMQFEQAVNKALLEVDPEQPPARCRLRITGRNISLQ
ncbi:type VI secretion system lipoprotein TssJ [Endozoicomonadaceae bacterium StTr2]